jgi:hypothetical protein
MAPYCAYINRSKTLCCSKNRDRQLPKYLEELCDRASTYFTSEATKEYNADLQQTLLNPNLLHDTGTCNLGIRLARCLVLAILYAHGNALSPHSSVLHMALLDFIHHLPYGSLPLSCLNMTSGSLFRFKLAINIPDHTGTTRT